MPKKTGAVATPVPALPGAFDLFRPSINAILFNLKTFVVLGVPPALLMGVLSAASVFNSHEHQLIPTPIVTLTAFLLFALGLILVPAITYTEIQSAKRRRTTIKHALIKARYFFWRMWGLNICLTLIFIVSFILLIVPFFFMLRRYILAPYYLVDRDMSIRQAMRQSAADSKRFSGAIWGIIGIQALIAIIGIVPFIGWAISGTANVLYFCAPAIRYVQIRHAGGEVSD